MSALFARDIEIVLEDTELGLPLEGAVIRSWDGTQYTCDEDGKAIVSVPDDRQVVIQAAYPGYETGRLVIPPDTNQFTLGLRLSGIMESRELVIEASKPGTSETKTGRSVAISGRDIAQTSEIGVIEDLMTSIKLLPGVGYAGLFDAHPSIRGGDPGDMRASLDGFYVFNPYHWGGGFSIFDPRMVESAQLSHGVFSSRYGHTISGLLDITTKKASSTETEYEIGMSTSAANLNLSIPLFGRGGIMIMGKVTYYDPVILLAKQLAKFVEVMRHVNSIRVAPYIRSGTITGNYRFLHNLELQVTGFWGMDGVGVTFDPGQNGGPESSILANFDYTNYQGFLTTGLSWNPRNDMLLKFTAGAGYTDSVIDGKMNNTVEGKLFSTEFQSEFGELGMGENKLNLIDFSQPSKPIETNIRVDQSDAMYNIQGRLDYDWELGNGFLAAAGVQEMFSQYRSEGEQQMPTEEWYGELFIKNDKNNEALLAYIQSLNLPLDILAKLGVRYPYKYDPNVPQNTLASTSGYALAEYTTPNNRFGAELGLRVDHFFLWGDNFTINSQPALNPRLNLDFNVFKNKGFVESFDLSAGTGLFSSVNDAVFLSEAKYNITEMKPNRSLTSILGAKLEFIEGLNINIEGYYKHIFDRTYITINTSLGDPEVQPRTDGVGRVWGIDAMLQKLTSRYWDGWISYSFSWAKYKDPNSGDADMGISGGVRGDDWYFPSYHRFHNLNLVLNIKPTPRFNIYTRFGLASGEQISERIGSGPISYPVLVYNEPESYFIEKYYWPSRTNENKRATPSMPLDIKFSIFGQNATGRTRYEVYFAIENVLALLYTAQGNTSFNAYTGEVSEGSYAASYDIPIPIPSFGFKLSY